jgi:hypothetical protein
MPTWWWSNAHEPDRSIYLALENNPASTLRSQQPRKDQIH